jgi:hypothetical protein
MVVVVRDVLCCERVRFGRANVEETPPPPLQAEMTGNDEQIQINNRQEDGLCKQKSFSDLKITFTQ